MKGFILVIVLCFSYQSIYAQISGIVKDKETNKAVPNVNILKKGTQFGVSTDVNGEFYSHFFKSGDTLLVSHLSYQSKVIAVNNFDMLIELTGLTEVLSSVLVETKKEVTEIIENPWVIDYEIIDDSTLIIAKIGNSGSRLELKQGGTSLWYQFPDIDRIEKDCLGNVFVIRNDTAFETVIDKKELKFKSFLYVSELELSQKYCEELINEKQYFSFFQYLNKVNSFAVFNDTSLNLFFRIYDKEDYKYAGAYESQYQSVKYGVELAGGHRMGENNRGDDLWYRDPANLNLLDNLGDFSALLTRLKVISKLVNYDDQLIILDNKNSEIVYFDEFHKVKEVKPIDFKFKKIKIKQIIQDPITESLYYFVKEQDKTNIYEFDFKSLEFEMVMSRKRHLEEVKIYKGLLYYLEYDVYDETRKLYKIVL